MPKVDNHHFYLSAIKKYGTTARGVNWLSAANQRVRFDAIFEFLPKDLSSSILVDAGCGFGDFFTYLQKKKSTPKEYIGIDIHSDMHSIASTKTGCKILQKDVCKDELVDAHYYICSGALNTLNSFEAHLFIANAYSYAKKAFIFNVLCDIKESETYNYMSKTQLLGIAYELDVGSVLFSEGYLEGDITVAFFR